MGGVRCCVARSRWYQVSTAVFLHNDVEQNMTCTKLMFTAQRLLSGAFPGTVTSHCIKSSQSLPRRAVYAGFLDLRPEILGLIVKPK